MSYAVVDLVSALPCRERLWPPFRRQRTSLQALQCRQIILLVPVILHVRFAVLHEPAGEAYIST